MAGELTGPLPTFLAPDALALLVAVTLDLIIGDPRYRFHPVRLMGGSLTGIENFLRRRGAEGYRGGTALFVLLALWWLALLVIVMIGSVLLSLWVALIFHIFVLYSLLALGDLRKHVWRVERALMRDDLPAARRAVGALVGRDTETLDAGGCRRAAIESFAENLTDGFLSPLFWYCLLGLPGIVLFKVVSTMDSMVGNKTPRYREFGWCGARLDDAMNYLPARMSLPLIALAATFLPGCSASKTWRVGLAQHSALPSPNSGWSEAAAAGAIQRRLVGPIHAGGALVTNIWLGEPSDPPASEHQDVVRATVLMIASGVLASVIAAALLSR